IALVALHALQVLHKESVVGVRIEKRLQVGMLLQFPIKNGLHAIHVLDSHCYNTERFMRVLARVVDYKVYHLPYLGVRAFLLAINPDLLLHHLMTDRRWPAWARESDEALMVDVM